MTELLPPLLVSVLCARLLYAALINDEGLYHGRRVEGLVALLGRGGTRIFFLLISLTGVAYGLRGVMKVFGFSVGEM